MGHGGCQHGLDHLRLDGGRTGIGRAAVAEAQSEERLGDLLGQGPRVDDRHGQPVAQVSVGLVHGRRAHADDVGAVLFDAAPGGLLERRQHPVLLADEQVVAIGLDVDCTDRGAPVGEAQPHPGTFGRTLSRRPTW